MRSSFIAATVLGLNVCAAFAQAPAVPPPAVDPRISPAVPSRQSAHETAVTDCERMWDRGTHMSKRDWSQTCRRVQNRLQQLEVR